MKMTKKRILGILIFIGLFSILSINPIYGTSIDITSKARSLDTINILPSLSFPPSEPLNVQATGGNTYVSLTWDTPSSDGGSPITNYVLYRGNTPGGESYLDYTHDNGTTYIDSSAANGNTYYYIICANNINGLGTNSTEVMATAGTTPTAPQNLQVEANGTQMNISWDVPLDNGGLAVTGYNICRSTVIGSEVLFDTIGNVTNYLDTGLTRGQTYYYQVSALNSAGESSLSGENYASVPQTVPDAPQNLQVQVSNAQAVLSWEAPTDNGGMTITEYKIYKGTTSGNEVYIASVYSGLSYTDSNMTDGQTYYYTVSAVNDKGESLQSNEINASISTSTSTPTSTKSGTNSIDGMGLVVLFPACLLGVVIMTLSIRKRLK